MGNREVFDATSVNQGDGRSYGKTGERPAHCGMVAACKPMSSISAGGRWRLPVKLNRGVVRRPLKRGAPARLQTVLGIVESGRVETWAAARRQLQQRPGPGTASDFQVDARYGTVTLRPESVLPSEVGHATAGERERRDQPLFSLGVALGLAAFLALVSARFLSLHGRLLRS